MYQFLGLTVAISLILQSHLCWATDDNTVDGPNGTPADVIVVDGDGDVGIGISNPSLRLQIYDNINDDLVPNMQIQNENQGTDACGYLRILGYGNNAVIKAYGDNHSTKANLVEFGTVAGVTDIALIAGGADRLHIDYDGNVGIGTTSPSGKLHVNGISKFDDDIKLGWSENNSGWSLEKGDGTKATLRFDADRARFYSKNGEMFSILEDGKIGIGTATPTGKLDVVGTDGTTKIASNGCALQFTRASASYIQCTSTGGALAFVTNGEEYPSYATSNLVLKADRNSYFNGNLGIGTTSPDALLHLTGNDPKIIFDDNAGEAQKDFSIFSQYGLLHIFSETNNSDIAVFGTEPDGFFKLFDENGNETLKLKGNGDINFNGGNVGIGTTAPSDPLTVVGRLRLEGNSSMYIEPNATRDGFNGHFIGTFSDGAGHKPLVFRTNGGNRMVIDNNGDIGIGTMEPQSKLFVQDGVGKFSFDGSVATSGYTAHIRLDDVGMKVGHNSSGRKLSLQTGNEDRLTIAMDGKVGIGETVPDALLHVAGFSPRILVDETDNGLARTGYSIGSNGQEVASVTSYHDDIFGRELTIEAIDSRIDLVVKDGTSGEANGLHFSNEGEVTLDDGMTINRKEPMAGGFFEGNASIGLGYSGSENTEFDLNFISEDGGINALSSNDFKVYTNGNTSAPLLVVDDQFVQVKTTLTAQEIIVQSSGADFVFEDDYKLRTLAEVEDHIKKEKHLPEIPKANAMQDEGMSVGQMQTKLLQKVEELTLYLIEQNKRIERLEHENSELKSKLN